MKRRLQSGSASGVPHARQLRVHGRGLSNVLVVGGDERWRLEVAGSFHHESPMRQGVLWRVDARFEEEQLVRALCSPPAGWVAQSAERLRTAAHGTLFVDWVTRLTPAAQRLLLTRACRPLGVTDGAEGWTGALIVGAPLDPAHAVGAGEFSAELYDALDKIRVESGARVRGAA